MSVNDWVCLENSCPRDISTLVGRVVITMVRNLYRTTILYFRGYASTMQKKGSKKLRGKPEMYEEVKERKTIALTPTASNLLKEKAHKFGLSVSEYIERVARQPTPSELSTPPANYDYSEFEKVVKKIESGEGGEEVKAAIALIEKYNLINEWLASI